MPRKWTCFGCDRCCHGTSKAAHRETLLTGCASGASDAPKPHHMQRQEAVAAAAAGKRTYSLTQRPSMHCMRCLPYDSVTAHRELASLLWGRFEPDWSLRTFARHVECASGQCRGAGGRLWRRCRLGHRDLCGRSRRLEHGPCCSAGCTDVHVACVRDSMPVCAAPRIRIPQYANAPDATARCNQDWCNKQCNSC